jgi:hypothetical protein
MSFSVSVSASWVELAHCEVRLVGDVGIRIERSSRPQAHECDCELVGWDDGLLSGGGMVTVVGDGLTFGWVSKQCQAAARSLRSLSVRLVEAIFGE